MVFMFRKKRGAKLFPHINGLNVKVKTLERKQLSEEGWGELPNHQGADEGVGQAPTPLHPQAREQELEACSTYTTRGVRLTY